VLWARGGHHRTGSARRLNVPSCWSLTWCSNLVAAVRVSSSVAVRVQKERGAKKNHTPVKERKPTHHQRNGAPKTHSPPKERGAKTQQAARARPGPRQRAGWGGRARPPPGVLGVKAISTIHGLQLMEPYVIIQYKAHANEQIEILVLCPARLS
jgi:hypothetical protein